MNCRIPLSRHDADGRLVCHCRRALTPYVIRSAANLKIRKPESDFGAQIAAGNHITQLRGRAIRVITGQQQALPRGELRDVGNDIRTLE
jgi:hypothetical protein